MALAAVCSGSVMDRPVRSVPADGGSGRTSASCPVPGAGSCSVITSFWRIISSRVICSSPSSTDNSSVPF